MEIIFCLIQASTNECGDPHVHCMEQKDSNSGALKYRSCLTNEPIGASTYTKLMPFYHSKSTIHGPGTWNSTINAINEDGGPHIHGMEQKYSNPGAVKYRYGELTQRPDGRSNTYPVCAALPFNVHHKRAWSSIFNAINGYGVHTSMAWSKKIQTLVQSNIARQV